MPGFRFNTVDVFTEQQFGGNPLAVFPDARGLSDADMQALARELNLSETSFVLPPEDPAHTARVRIFNTSHEMAFAGHPNVGTGYVLACEDGRAGDVLRFEEPAGLVEVRIERDAAGVALGAAVDAPQPLSIQCEIAPDLLAACAGLGRNDILLSAHAPVLASTGNPLVFAECAAEALAAAAPSLPGFRDAVRRLPALGGRLGLNLYARAGHARDRDGHARHRIRSRVFSPLDGTWEDPATGSAATTLAALLLSLGGEHRQHWEIVQGTEMQRPSLLRAQAWRDGAAIRATVAGRCVPVLRGEALLGQRAPSEPCPAMPR